MATKSPTYVRKMKKSSPIGRDHPLAKMHIRIGIEGKSDSIKRIPRLKLTTTNIESIYGVKPYYLKDDTGNVLFPKDWQTKCLGPPVLYIIKERPKKYTETDAYEDINYDGEFVLCLLDVPMHVDGTILEKFIRFALKDEDPAYNELANAIADSKKKMKEAEEKLANIPFLQIREAANAKEEQAERLMMSNFLNAELKRLGELLSSDETKMRRLKRRRNAEKYDLQRKETDESTGMSIWHVVFESSDVGLARGSVLLKKDDWFDYRVFRDVDGSIRVCRGELPEDVDARTEVNLRSIKIVRRRHGKGLLRVGHKERFVEGLWKNGHVDGHGRIFSKYFIFDGDVKNGLIDGKGEMRFRDGSVFEGTLVVDDKHKDHNNAKVRPLIRENEYHEGIPHGENGNIVRFADGSVYEGAFRDGKICGEGVYRRADGTILRGTFKDGMLHGNGSVVDPHGRLRCSGTWQFGTLHGTGSIEAEKDEANGIASKRSKGRFVAGALDGLGEVSRNDRRHFGFWKSGRPHGIGTLMYQKRASIPSRPSNTFDGRKYHEIDYGNLLDGCWRNGRVGPQSYETQTTRRRPEGVCYFANEYMKTRFARALAFERADRAEVCAIEKREIDRRRELEESELKKTRDSVQKYSETFDRLSKDAISRLRQKERRQKERLREQRRKEAEMRRKQAEEEAAMFKKMREAMFHHPKGK